MCYAFSLLYKQRAYMLQTDQSGNPLAEMPLGQISALATWIPVFVELLTTLCCAYNSTRQVGSGYGTGGLNREGLQVGGYASIYANAVRNKGPPGQGERGEEGGFSTIRHATRRVLERRILISPIEKDCGV